MNTYQLVLVALGASIIAVLAQVSIPLPPLPVPITGQTLAIGLVVTILGTKLGTLSVLLYILLGAIGLPVFAQFKSGLSVLVGPTGGFIVGFIPTALLIGLILEKTSYNYAMATVANVVGMCVTLAFGVIWLKYGAELTWAKALAAGVTPFIIPGLLKAALASWVGIIVRKRLQSAQSLSFQKSS